MSVDHLAYTIDAPYRHSTGPAVGRFLGALAEGRILGRHCPGCRHVVVPPAEHCAACARTLGEWEEVGPDGTVRAVTVVHEPLPLVGLEPPFAVVAVRLDGAGTDLIHLAPSPAGIVRDARVRALWSDQPSGTIRDLVGFVASDGGPGTRPATAGGVPVTHVDTTLELPYRQALSAVETTFRAGIRDGRVLGIRCTVCAHVHVPARPHCPRCWAPCEGWIEVADTGTVETYVVVNVPFQGQEVDIPYCLAHVRLDGADSALVHLVGVEGPDGRLTMPAVSTGMRVRAVWRPAGERTGAVNDDITHFRPDHDPSSAGSTSISAGEPALDGEEEGSAP